MDAVEGGSSPIHLPEKCYFTCFIFLFPCEIPTPHSLALHCENGHWLLAEGCLLFSITSKSCSTLKIFLLPFFKGTPKHNLDIHDNGDFYFCICLLLRVPSRKNLIVKSQWSAPSCFQALVLCRTEYFKWCPWDYSLWVRTHTCLILQ